MNNKVLYFGIGFAAGVVLCKTMKGKGIPGVR